MKSHRYVVGRKLMTYFKPLPIFSDIHKKNFVLLVVVFPLIFVDKGIRGISVVHNM